MKRDYRFFTEEDFIELIEMYEVYHPFYRNAYQDLLNLKLSKLSEQMRAALQTEKKLSLQLKKEENLSNRRKIRESLSAVQAQCEILRGEWELLEKLRTGGKSK
ncbi:MAG: hypothetical protein Q4A78_08740 [Peptostreptococcaceae bacterium]|nr:hypothetical protein [Peptostreptococcaceae bacterium]